jgi:hypothetical protein
MYGHNIQENIQENIQDKLLHGIIYIRGVDDYVLQTTL